MTIRITDWLVTSDKTSQCAASLDPAHPESWTVSWLPLERIVHRDQVVTAVLLAEWIGTGVRPGHQLWPHVEGLAAELDLTAAEAVAMVTAADLLTLEAAADADAFEGADQ